MNDHPVPFSPTDRDQLEQELLELHFGCHEAPERLQARLAAEPALRALQAEVLQKARTLERAVRPEQPPLDLPQPGARRHPLRWLRHPAGRLLTAAAVAAATVLGFFAASEVAQSRLAQHQHDHLHLTVSAPKAVPAGAPWSFTVQAKDLAGTAADCRVRWQTLGDPGGVLAAGEAPVRNGAATVMVAALADLRVPQRIEVLASNNADEVREVLSLSTANAGPLVHVTTDRPVYRPGEPVFARAVVLDRVTLLPLPGTTPMQATLLDGKGAPVVSCYAGNEPAGVGSFLMTVPADSAGGPHRVQVASLDGRFPTETAEIVVRSFRTPQLDTTITLDRTTYAPGARGSATVTVERMGGAGASGAHAKAALVLDGTEVWSEQKALGAYGEATFAFAVPSQVEHGAARFVATISDGGIVETEVRPFVVPTGKVLVAGFPEGGELIAGVENGLYLECTDTLGRPVDGAGEVLDDHDQQVAKFRTAHQGRVKVGFVPREGSSYRVQLAGHDEPFALPSVKATGIAMRLPGTDVAAGEPLRLEIAGRGDGPWLLGVFCRGVLVGQTTLRADDRGELRTLAEVPLADHAAGVLRATVFDHNLQPIAERLVRRTAAHRIDVELVAKHGALAPGDNQQVTVRTKDETGQAIASVVGLSVTDLAAASLGSEPRIGLADQAMLFADVERTEELGDFLLGHTDAAQHVDLLLGTRGWRRFVWRNDAAAQAAIAAHGQTAEGVLAREGFSQTPQVASNLQAALAPGASLAQAAHRSSRHLTDAAGVAAVALFLLLVGELMAWLLRRGLQARPVLQVVGGLAVGAALLLGASLLLRSEMTVDARLVPEAAADFEAAGGRVDHLGAANPPRLVFPEARFVFDDFGETAVIDLNGLGQGAGFLPPRIRDIPGDLAWFPEQEARTVVRRFADANEEPAPGYFDLGASGWVTVAGAFDRTQWRERQYAHRQTPHEGRSDFTPTIFWSTLVATNQAGEATVSFATSDAVTTWLVQADAHLATGSTGRVGQAEAKFTARLPFHLEAKLPDEVSRGDALRLPIAALGEGVDVTAVTLQTTVGNGLRLGTDAPTSLPLTNGRGRTLLPITIAAGADAAQITLRGTAGRFTDTVTHTLRIAPRGFPHERSVGGTVVAGQPSQFVVTVPREPVAGSGHLVLKVFPAPVTSLTEGLAGILREPHGCFEQASSSNYPNTLVLTLLEANGDNLPTIAARARQLLPQGYAKITGYECKQRGYEWFGADPGHIALTAYGLLEFHDMAKVYAVDADMVERTRQWLLARRDGHGGFTADQRALDHFGGSSHELTDAYVVYALLQAGTTAATLQQELANLVTRRTTADPYELALISAALQLADHPEAAATRARLATLQQPDGSLHGTTTSITRSGGQDLVVETTGFAALAWLPDARFQNEVRRAVEFLQSCRTASGTFGATQATIVALRAITGYAQQNRTMREAGTLRVFEGQQLLAERSFAATETEALQWDLWSKLPAGEHTLRLELEGGGTALPYACGTSYHAELPADDPDPQVAITTTLRANTVAEGDTVALDVEVENRTATALPMTMAIVGLPAGLELPTRVLEDLQKANAFAFWELHGRELALYWRELPPAAVQKLTLDLVARIPGQSTGPASRTYLYYTPQQKRWAAPLRIDVTPAR